MSTLDGRPVSLSYLPSRLCWGQDLRCGIGYPDFIETAKGEIYLSETDKKDSRVHLLPNEMLELMWRQSSISERLHDNGRKGRGAVSNLTLVLLGIGLFFTAWFFVYEVGN